MAACRRRSPINQRRQHTQTRQLKLIFCRLSGRFSSHFYLKKVFSFLITMQILLIVVVATLNVAVASAFAEPIDTSGNNSIPITKITGWRSRRTSNNAVEDVGGNFATVDGVIGVAKAHLKLHYGDARCPLAHGRCMWFGTAPFCQGACPSPSWTRIQEENDYRNADATFGSYCYSGKKTKCCYHDVVSRCWAGDWLSSKSMNVMHCSYRADESTGRCGGLDCTFEGQRHLGTIDSENCNQVTIMNATGSALFGWMHLGGVGFYKTTTDSHIFA